MKTIILALIIVSTVIQSSGPTLAAESDTTTSGTNTTAEDKAVAPEPDAVAPVKNPDLGFSTIKETLPTSKYENSSWVEIGTQIFNVLNTIVAFLAFFGLIISGVMLITAGGDPDKAEKAKKNIVWVVTGIVIYLLSLYILPVTRGIIESNFIKQVERQQALNDGISMMTQIQALFLRAMGIIQ